MDRYRNGPLRQKPGAVLSDKLLEQERIAKRIFGAMILNDLLQEVHSCQPVYVGSCCPQVAALLPIFQMGAGACGSCVHLAPWTLCDCQ